MVDTISSESFNQNGNSKNDENYTQCINFGEMDQMEIIGFKQSKLKTTVTWIFYIFTLGILRLLYHWYPHWKLYSTHTECDLEVAEKVLFIDTYKEKYKSYIVKQIKILSLDNFRAKDEYCDVVKDLYKSDARKMSTTLSVHMTDGTQELKEIRAVKCKKLLYAWNPKKKCFMKIKGLDTATTKSELHSYTGYNRTEQSKRRITYGKNEINVPIVSIGKLLALEALTPFYVFQIFSIIVWVSEFYYYYCIAIVVMSVFGITSSIIQTRKNQKNLQGTVHSIDKISVCRSNGVFEDIPTTHLVPGDVIEIPAHGCIMHCDAVLLNGHCIVNESMLTGESVPVMKTPLPHTNDFYHVKEDATHTLFCGTKVIQTRYYGGDKVLAVVIRTGYLTAKGQLVRSIMYPPPADFKFDQDSYKFIGILAVIALIGFIYTVASKSTRGITPLDILIKALDIVTIVIPPALPAAMTVGKLYALIRLKNHKIFCMNSRVINVSGSVNCICFDKTGTLTEDGLDMWGVVPVENGVIQNAVKDLQLIDPGSLFVKGMSTCHSLTLIDNILVGDPLDVKMFESTGWILEEPNVTDCEKYDLLVPTIVKPVDNNYTSEYNIQNNLEIGIVHQYQFSSTLQRMSVITKTLSSDVFEVFCKGSPEMIISLSKPTTVPKNIFKVLKEYTEKGYRVIALGSKQLAKGTNYLKIKKMRREEAECDLEFVGLIVLENRLKHETTSVIKELKDADIKVVMITGDNIQTALSVARECGIIDPTEQVIDVEAVRSHTKHDRYIFKFNINTLVSNEIPIDKLTEAHHVDIESGKQSHRFAMTGTTWSVIKQYYPELIPKIVNKGTVFARMSGEQKQQLIEELQSLGYYVAMCGDGANDCGALKAAHVGISLSEAESSVASPLTSKRDNISCVPLVIREGRAALVTSFGVFKFMLCYSLTEFTSVIILYGIDANLTSIQFLFIDIFLVLNFASLFGKTDAYTGKLFPTPPMTSLLSFVPLASIITHMLVIIAFQVGVYHMIQGYDWFQPFQFDPENPLKYNSYENYAIYSLSMFQYIVSAIVFSKGIPYRQPIYTNKLFSFSLFIMTIICAYMTVYPADWILQLFEIKLPPYFDVRTMILLLAALNLTCTLVMEECIVEVILNKTLGSRWKRFKKKKCKREETEYESIVDCDMKAVIYRESIDEISERKQNGNGLHNPGFNNETSTESITTAV